MNREPEQLQKRKVANREPDNLSSYLLSMPLAMMWWRAPGACPPLPETCPPLPCVLALQLSGDRGAGRRVPAHKLNAASGVGMRVASSGLPATRLPSPGTCGGFNAGTRLPSPHAPCSSHDSISGNGGQVRGNGGL
ncbi:MAG: hypothetical protein JRJ38_11655 [Deltaproteobacteria bacterium]|nr:hypothetical protein [Deltaproteobacteria bacterium]